MTELVNGATELDSKAASLYAADLLRHYSFDLDDCTADQLIESWLETYSPEWIKLAIIEALYQGRYKAVSVEQILALWKRRGQTLYHFSHEFERLIGSAKPSFLRDNRFQVGKGNQPLAEEQGCTSTGNGSDSTQTGGTIGTQSVLPVPFLSSLGLADSSLKPKLRLHLTSLYQPRWIISNASKHPIDQFTPASEVSSFYSKLKAVAQSADEG
jgi:hypothetical protein